MNYYYRFTYAGRGTSSIIKFNDMLGAVNFMMKDIENNPSHINGQIIDEDYKTVCIARTIL
jgi:hypothetical protein